MAEEKVIAEFEKCPYCGAKETLTQMAWRETHGSKQQDIFVSFFKDAVPLTATSPQVTFSLPTAPCLLIDRDFCAGCGAERVTRAQIKNMPLEMIQAQGFKPLGRPTP